MMSKYYLLIFAGLLIVAALLLLRQDTLLHKNNVTEITGQITGLPTKGEEERRVIIEIVDPTSALLTGGETTDEDFSSYKVAISPGPRMAAVRVLYYGSNKAYFGASKIFNVSEGETVEADVEVKEKGTLGALIKTAYAQEEEKPVFAVASRSGLYEDYAAHISTELSRAGNRIITIDETILSQFDEELNRPELPTGTYGSFSPRVPNFAIILDFDFYLGEPAITATIINVELNNNAVWQKTIDPRKDTRTSGSILNTTRILSDDLVKAISGEGNYPVHLPGFTPSLRKPVDSAVSFGKAMRKLLGLKEKPNFGPSNLNTFKEKPYFTSSPTSTPAPSCDFNGFVACRDTFNLQGCIDACPFVPIDCPPGTPPNTECKETDQTCSNTCWDQGTTHGSHCASQNHCTMQEIDVKLRAQ